MSTKSRGQVQVFNLGKSNSLTLCFGDIGSPDGATYQEIENPVMVALIKAAVGSIPEGERKKMSIQFEESL